MNKRTAVLVSGSSTLLEAMPGHGFTPDLVIADRPCRGISEVAPRLKIPSRLIERTDFGGTFDRTAFTQEMINALQKEDIGIVAMAGYKTVFSAAMFEAYDGLILNTHPSLLPAFKGNYAVRDTLASGVKVTGCTIHIATEVVDDEGRILAQEQVAVLPTDTVDTLHEAIKRVERRLYPETILKFIGELEAAEAA